MAIRKALPPSTLVVFFHHPSLLYVALNPRRLLFHIQANTFSTGQIIANILDTRGGSTIAAPSPTADEQDCNQNTHGRNEPETDVDTM